MGGWNLGPELVADATTEINLPFSVHPDFQRALAEHLAERLTSDEGWRRRALVKLRDAVRDNADLRRLGVLPSDIRAPEGDEWRGFPVGAWITDRTKRRRAQKGYEKAWPAGWKWTSAKKGQGALGFVDIQDDARGALAQAEARAQSIVYMGTGRVAHDWTPPAGIPRMVIRALSVSELKAAEADAGIEPTRPAAPIGPRLGDDPYQEQWRAWLAWRARRDQGLCALGWVSVLVDNKRMDPAVFLDRLQRGAGARAALDAMDEAAQHIARLTYLPASLGKESGGPSGSPTEQPGAADE